MSFWRYFKNDIKDTSDQKEFHLQVLEFRLLEGISEINPSCSHQRDSVEVVQTSDQDSSWSPPCGRFSQQVQLRETPKAN